MQGEIRVTVIATGFDRALHAAPAAIQPQQGVAAPKGSPVIPFPANRPARVTGANIRPPAEPVRAPKAPTEKTAQDLSDMEIPTFIRRQMD